jgi:hypothetical protein
MACLNGHTVLTTVRQARHFKKIVVGIRGTDPALRGAVDMKFTADILVLKPTIDQQVLRERKAGTKTRENQEKNSHL